MLFKTFPVFIFIVFFVFRFGVRPYVKNVYVKYILGTFICIAAFKYHILYLIRNVLFQGANIPLWIELFLTWAFSVLLFFLPFLICFAAIECIIKILKKQCSLSISGRWHIACGFMRLVSFFVIAVMSVIGIVNGFSVPQVNEVKIKIDKWH